MLFTLPLRLKITVIYYLACISIVLLLFIAVAQINTLWANNHFELSDKSNLILNYIYMELFVTTVGWREYFGRSLFSYAN